MKRNPEHRPIPFIRKLCAQLSEEEVVAAEERFRAYIRLALRIHSRRSREKQDQNIDN